MLVSSPGPSLEVCEGPGLPSGSPSVCTAQPPTQLLMQEPQPLGVGRKSSYTPALAGPACGKTQKQ